MKRSESVKEDYEDHSAEMYKTTRSIKTKRNSEITSKPTQQLISIKPSQQIMRHSTSRFTDNRAAFIKQKRVFDLITDPKM